MNIIYGGSFNPPTKAHLKVCKTLLKLNKSNKIFIIPVGNDYKKTFLIDSKYRLDMLKIMFKKYKRVIISDYEIKNHFSGTISTLKHYEKKYNEKFALAIGMDNLIEIETWINADELLKNYYFYIFTRDFNQNRLATDKLEYLILKYNLQFELISFNEKISSSKIRNNYPKYKKYTTRSIRKYIKKNKLYGVSNEK